MTEGTVNHQAPCPMIEALGVTRLNIIFSVDTMMADISEYSIVTYQRKYGHWRAAIFFKARIGRVGGETVLSVVTPDDFASEAEAQFAAEKLIRKL